jgi:uncharacterized protein (DUF2062 family)
VSRLDFNTLLLIPVYNHSETIRDVVEKALLASWQVLVIDDGSSQSIASLLADLSCRVHTLPVNQGKGAAILAGAKIAAQNGFDAILTLDADGQHDPHHALKLLANCCDHWPCIVIGDRQMKENVPASSRFGRSFSNFWVQLETGLRLPDTQSGMRLYPVKEILQLDLRKTRYDLEIEILVRSAWAGIPIHSVSVPVFYPEPGRRQSHFHPGLDNLRLTALHTKLIIRSLIPLPHKKLIVPKTQTIERGLLLHPVHFFKMLLQEHMSPVLVAAAVWLGIFLGTLPLLACHTIAILYATHKLHLNKIVAVAASQICMPPVVPALCIELGFFIRHGIFLTEISRQTLIMEIDQRLWEYLLGSLVIGPVLGFVVAGLVYAIHSNLKNRLPVKNSR